MPKKHIRIEPVYFSPNTKDGGYEGSVSVASPDALVVIQELAISGDGLMGYAVVTEDIDE